MDAVDGSAVTRPRSGWQIAHHALVVLALVAFGATVRIGVALSDEGFDADDATGMLKSDPGLLYYLTERVLDAGGGVPEDFRADPRIEYPRVVDAAATFTVGQEWLVAWCYRAFGGDVPLHVFCIWLMAIVASIVAAGVYGLAWELTRSRLLAAGAAVLYALTPASYRTIGFILIREDLSLPLFALHLWLLARAARVRTAGAWLGAGALLGCALATWHAMVFLVALEAGLVFVWYLRSGENGLALARAWIVPAVVALFAIAVPALQAKLTIFSLPLQIGAALLVAARVADGARGRWTGPLVALGVWGALLTLSLVLSYSLGGGMADHSHVLRTLWAKLVHLGQRPDPSVLSFEARLLWQGPFATASFADMVRSYQALLLLALPALLVTVSDWRRSDGDRGVSLVGGFAALALVSAWLVVRLSAITAILLPVLAATVGRRRPRILAPALYLAIAFQSVMFLNWARGYRIPWYQPSLRQDEIATLVRELPSVVPAGEAVAADFINSTAILVHTGRPIVLQPKWESVESRRRVERFWSTFYHESPAALRRLLLEEYRCRYLLVDRFTLWILRASRALAGLSADDPDPPPDTAAAAFLSRDAAELAAVPGFELLWRSPASLLQSNGQPSDFFRLYRIVE